MNEINKITFFYTYKCNANCRHCIYCCDSKRKEKMDPKIVSKQLKEITETGIKKVCFSGGEPLIYSKEIIPLIREAKKNGIKTEIISNGFWATSEKETTQMINELKKSGLNDLKISVGPLHQEFIPIENVLRILKEKERVPSLHINLWLETIRNEKLLDILNVLSKKRKFLSGFNTVVPFGRAANLPEKELSYYENIKEKCFFTTTVIAPNQKAFICCFGALKGKNSPYFIGNTRKKSLKEIIWEHRKNKLVEYLQSKGPYKLVKELGKRRIKPLKLNRKKKFVFLCHYCIEKISSYRKEDLMQTLNELS